MKVLHIISGLNVGGAELMMIRLATALEAYSVQQVFVSISSEGPLMEVIRVKGFRLYSLNCKRGRVSLSALLKLAKIFMHERPDLTQSWMFHADLIGGFFSKILFRTPVVWNIRQSDTHNEKFLTRLISVHVNRFLSYFVPNAIICCGNYVADFYKNIGYRANLIVPIPNGYELPHVENASGHCNSPHFGEDFTIGVSGRFHPMKDHKTFIEAAGIAYCSNRRIRFLLCGEGLDEKNTELMRWIEASCIPFSRISLLGRIEDMKFFYRQLHLMVSSSCGGEGFPNVLAEAMSFGVPCIATNIGGNAEVIGDSSLLAPVASPIELAKLILKFSRMNLLEYQVASANCKVRIKRNFRIEVVAKRYYQLYEQVLGR
jgi:glycosyltransferase involved in cell wall biosynthesis